MVMATMAMETGHCFHYGIAVASKSVGSAGACRQFCGPLARGLAVFQPVQEYYPL